MSISPHFLDKLQIIIATWNGDDVLKRCLDSLSRVYGDLPSMIIVDNANCVSTKALVAKYPSTTYISSKTNLGFAGGNNLGYKFCDRKYVILLNNDTEFIEDSITPLIDFMDTHPNVGAAQGSQVFGFDPSKSIGCALMLTPRGQLFSPKCMESKDDPVCQTPCRVFAGGGGFLIVRRAAISAIGGRLFFPEFESYYEDVDLGRRLGMCGFESWYVPTPPLVHYMGATAKKLGPGRAEFFTQRNQWYSLFYSYSLYGILKFLPWLLTLYFILPLVKFKWKALRFNTSALISALKNWSFIRKARGEFMPLRKLSDRKFLKLSIAAQPISYHLGLNHI